MMLKNIRFNIKNQILFGYLILIGVFMINTAVSAILSSKYENVINESTTVIQPSLIALVEYNLLINESKNLTNHWVSNELDDTKEKKELKKIHATTFKRKKKALLALVLKWKSKENKVSIANSLTQLESSVIKSQKHIMNSLSSFDDYGDIMIKMEIDESNEKINIYTKEVVNAFHALTNKIKLENQTSLKEIQASFKTIKTTGYVLAIVILIIGIALGLGTAKRITRPIIQLKSDIDLMAKGILPDIEIILRKDEVGDMSSAIDKLVQGLKTISSFAQKVGNGELNTVFDKLSDDDILGGSLIEMRDNLELAKSEDEKRGWAAVGMGTFGVVLRKNNDNLQLLSKDIISSLIKYLEANQGGLFVLNKENEDRHFMELTACYAYDRQKKIEKEILLGEGLIGQCWQEMEKIHLTDVPSDYITITSGLGDANPTTVFLCPLMLNDEIYGVLEIATFKELQPHHVKFLEKLSESVASTFSTVQVNIRTAKLLDKSRNMSEQMQAQEEELRQNAEEMLATQEEMQRKIDDLETKLIVKNN